MEFPYSCDVSDAMPPAAAPDSPAAKPKRKKGRPKRADAPIVPWDLADKALVFGERVVDPTNGQEGVRFPSLAELAERYGVSRNRVWQYANKAGCFRRREAALLKTQTAYERKVIESVSGARALAAEDVVRVVDAFVLGFERELADGKVRTDSAADLDRLVRLKELLLGRSDSRSELHGELSLAAIQERHRKLRGQVDGMTAELTGTGSTDDASSRELAGVIDADAREFGSEEAGDGSRH